MTTVRFAPSPTGLLHVGNARMALVNWLYARATGGKFILRLDDTDKERSTDAFALAIERDLAWLGLAWDGLYRQSERLDSYDLAFAELKDKGRVYACFETPEELAYKRKRQLKRGRPPIYDRAALGLSDSDVSALEAAGRKPHWRFKLQHSEIAFDDLVRGPVTFDGALIGDPVIRRGDESFLYMLPSTVDDMEMNVTHIIRGEDHVTNSAVQIQLFEALGGTPPVFAHLPLMTDIHGAGLPSASALSPWKHCAARASSPWPWPAIWPVSGHPTTWFCSPIWKRWQNLSILLIRAAPARNSIPIG